MGVKTLKLPSGELNNFELIEQLAKINNEIVLSTGMASFKEIGSTIKYLKKRLKKELTKFYIVFPLIRLN